MLEEYQKIYKMSASYIPNWESQSKSELIRNCINATKENNIQLRESYVSAILLKYWGALTNFYLEHHSSKITTDDFYNWLIQAVLSVIKRPIYDEKYLILNYKDGRVRKTSNKLYGIKNSPDLCMIKSLYSAKKGFYQYSNYDIRKVNYMENVSVDALKENNENYRIPYFDNSYRDHLDLLIKIEVAQTFKDKKYYEAFILEGILNGDVFELSDGNYIFSKKKLVKHLTHLDDNYCHIVSNYFDIDEQIVMEAQKVFYGVSSKKIYKIIDRTLDILKTQILKLDDTTNI